VKLVGLNMNKILLKIFNLPWFVWKKFWLLVWDISETTYIPLGIFAPWVFSQMIGCKYRKIR